MHNYQEENVLFWVPLHEQARQLKGGLFLPDRLKGFLGYRRGVFLLAQLNYSVCVIGATFAFRLQIFGLEHCDLHVGWKPLLGLLGQHHPGPRLLTAFRSAGSAPPAGTTGFPNHSIVRRARHPRPPNVPGAEVKRPPADSPGARLLWGSPSSAPAPGPTSPGRAVQRPRGPASPPSRRPPAPGGAGGGEIGLDGWRAGGRFPPRPRGWQVRPGRPPGRADGCGGGRTPRPTLSPGLRAAPPAGLTRLLLRPR